MAYTYTSINNQRVQTDVASAFHRLNAAFKAATGLSLVVMSGTRTTAEQRNIFLSRYTRQSTGVGPYGDVRWYNGVRYVRTSPAGTVAVPGTSNHEEGGPIGPRALDIRDTGSNAGVSIAGNSRSNWIRYNARTYGFNPAGYNFGEPWHIEYTGSFGGSGSPAGGETGSTIYEQWGGVTYVKDIQAKLNRLGYGLVVDGIPGPKTVEAISAFQGKHGLTTDGVAGPLTKAKLDAVLASATKLVVDGEWGGATTRALQKALGVAVDGEIGPITIKALQKALGVSQDGELGPITIKALQKVVGATQDGQLGSQTVMKLQTYLNSGGKFVTTTPTPTPEPVPEKLIVDGDWGPATTSALQRNLKVTPVDGQLGSITIKALQKATGQSEDGQMGPKTIKALQTNVGAVVDGQLGPNTVKKLQEFLNANKVFQPVRIEDVVVVTYPKPAAPTYPEADWWHHSPNSSPRRDTDKIEYFVIHHAADTNTLEVQRDRFMRANDRNVSPNWLIGKGGEVLEIVPPDKYRAWTTGSFDYKAVTVETQNTSGDPSWGISEESHVAIAKLVAWAHLRWGIPLDRQHVIGHREVPGVSPTACPGPSMNLNKILSYAIALVKPTDPVEPTEPEPTPDPETWTITLSKAEAVEMRNALNKIVGKLPTQDNL